MVWYVMLSLGILSILTFLVNSAFCCERGVIKSGLRGKKKKRKRSEDDYEKGGGGGGGVHHALAYSPSFFFIFDMAPLRKLWRGDKQTKT
ncbi:MAG: hypothetical protein JOS17DRAFT_105646 [Linnemannia elongata]|nr:MAG: hypothetical protein JOS17DRAFT_105646 [Linnemannia elongata]